MSNIDKDRRNRSGTGYKTTGAGSFGTLNVSSEMTIGGLKGDTGWSGITNIASGDSSVVVSASAVTSGYPIHTGLNLTTVASHKALSTSVSTVVNGVSFVLEVDEAVVDTQEVYYTIIGG